jgi:hypothetical protein
VVHPSPSPSTRSLPNSPLAFKASTIA